MQRQKKAPIYEALEKFRRQRVVPFDVPGHKRGRGKPELVELLGEKCVGIDVDSMKPLDNLCHPVSVIKDAEDLPAAAQDYILYLEKAVGCKITYISVGAEREAYVHRD